MIHNGIEYGVMAAYAEGLEHSRVGSTLVLQSHDEGRRDGAAAESLSTTAYEFEIPAIAEVWRRGSVVASWLLDLTAEALAKSPTLSEFSGRVSDSGEGRWTVLSAVEEAVPVPAPVLTAALYERFSSRGESGLRRSGALGDAQGVRRPRREARRRLGPAASQA